MKKLNSYLIACLLTIVSTMAIAQEDDQVLKAEYGKFALTNAKIYTVTKGVIENGTLVINNGIIEAVGANVQIPNDAKVIDVAGKEIYPGMIDGGTTLGLNEIGSIAEAQDYREYGAITPQMEALTAVNPNAVTIPVTRVSGVTTVWTMPQGGVLPGTAAAINLFGYTPDQMYAGQRGIVMNFPSTAGGRRWRRLSEDEIKKRQERAMKEINETWDKAELYAKIENAEDVRNYPEIEALVPVVKGETPIFIEVNAAQDILNAIEWIKGRGYKQVVLTGVAEGWRVADEIAESGYPVIAGPVQAIPTRSSDSFDAAYANPGIMSKAGVKVALRTMDNENARNLPYHAGFAAAYGMGKEEALKAITINAAEILGVGDQIGSIEVGKKANFFVSTGDPFETATKITDLFIDGYKVPMTSRHIRLYDEFLNRATGVDKTKPAIEIKKK
ncbi:MULTISPECIES: amidohydrolase family protein [Roseivirga]|jgi:imidazolonepropionase-like amidohydrolase|uniref:Amidohydrolase n=2 Tax=Roseivirga TaxID=290180 RepID=A0A150X3U3_9BACT|nr:MULTISPECIES: amidohydrolase family protein [Roseivirga]KYG73389.1 amidohydrolase [Roseivirga spongicola]MBO6497097.1 amidohydrolase family protein [Roseivirga sp.]MBO6659637.1 amidohydrolase family protein [Roseivirga sp.]MBO6760531.1 amidohydrolase family protein [Roseivirga sp.]MBO6907626.1 amidohydrolase family protein [Roseivirga sp.]